jgi:iron complex outermembrane receptor protein
MLERMGASSGAGLLALLLSSTATTALAQAQAAADTVVEDVIVTAQRREQRLQDVPIAISAITPQELERRGTENLTSLVGAVPSLSMTNSGGVSTATLVTIRGIAGQPLAIGAGQATAFYIDGVYLARTDAGFWALDDVERVEVLRGPQGTLYGRNATAGAISIITRTPGDTVEGSSEVAYGNYNSLRLRASLRGPLGGGLSGGVSGSLERRDGFFINTFNGRRFPGRTIGAARGKLRYRSPEGDFDAVIAADYSTITGGATATKNLYDAGGRFVDIGDPKFVTLDQADRQRQQVRSQGVALTMTYSPNEMLELTSVSSYRDLDSLYKLDPDNSALPIFFLVNDFGSEALYQELRAAAHVGALTATFGANYFHEDATLGVFLGAPSSPERYDNPYDTTKLNAYGVFAQLEYELTDQVTLVAGARYNAERRRFTVDYRGFNPLGRFTEGKLKDDVVIPSVGVNFRVTPDILVYAKASEGYQAPGFNSAPGATAPVQTFDAEDLWAYEAGVKSQFLDRRLTVNIAGFYYDYSDIQIRSQLSGTTVVQNAASSTVKGVETSVSLRVLDGLTLGGQVSYLSAKYGEFCQPISAGTPIGTDPLCSPGFADRSGNRLNQAPKWSGGVNANYSRDVGDAGTLSIFASYAWESSSFYTTPNEPELSTKGWEKLDAQVSFKFNNNVEVFAYGRNLTDDRYKTFAQRLNAAIVGSAINDPRTYGVGVRHEF